MTTVVQIIQGGDSLAIALPPHILAKLDANIGDSVYLTDSPGGIRITAHDEDFPLAVEAADPVMHQNREVLKLLAE